MAYSDTSFFSMRSVAIITGASRGIGRAVAEEFAKRFSNGLYLILVSRSEEDLQETVSRVKADPQFTEDKTKIKCVVGDLGNQAVFEDVLKRIFQDVDPSNYEHAILVNNAASLGNVDKYIRDYSANDVENIQNYTFLNINSPFLLSSKFLSVFTVMDHDNEKGHKLPSRQSIIHMSSICAHTPFKSWSTYCIGKAARDMSHRAIAKEQPAVRVLNYSPGPVFTNMTKESINRSVDADQREYLKEVLRTKGFQPHETAAIMCDFLEKDEYDNAAHVSAFDIIGTPKKT